MKPFTMPTAEPFLFKGDDLGFLLIHGFTGTPKEMRLLGDHLAAQGHTVLGMRLAGHATKIEDMKRARWQDWLASVEDGINLLRTCCSQVVTIGLSMGGVLSILAAAIYPLDAAVAISAPYQLDDWRLPFLRPLSVVVPYASKGHSDMKDKENETHHADYTSYPTRAIIELDALLKETRMHAPEITIPVLLIHSKADQGVPFTNMEKYFSNIPSKQKSQMILENSGHVVTEDIERETAFKAIDDFVKQALT